MKKLITILASVFLIGIVAGCSNNENTDSNNDTPNDTQEQAENSQDTDQTADDTTNSENEDTDNADTTQNNNNKHDDAVDDNDDATNKMKELSISEFELEVDYPDRKEFDAEIELKSDGTYTSELKDDMNSEYLKGQEAFDKLYPMAKNLNITPDTSKEDAIKQLIDAFNLDKNYEELEIEFHFHDSNKELEFEDE